MPCRSPRSRNICACWRRPVCFGAGAMAGFTKCDSMPNRSGRPPSGWRSIASSGRGRSIDWPNISKMRTGHRKKGKRNKRGADMCPACIANITLVAAGATSGGGVAAFVFNKFYKGTKRIKAEENQNEKTSRKEEAGGETFQNRVAERVGGRAPTTGREGEGVN